MVYRYFIILDYNGGNYHGWQLQPNGITVQQVVNNALSLLLGSPVNVTGCGRTDTGVNARNFVAHFDSEKSGLHQNPDFVFKLNRFFNDSIYVHKIALMHADAHSRFDAVSRQYKYYIHIRKDPFLTTFSHFVYQKIDIGLMQQAAALLLNYTDFTSFSKVDTDTKTNICKIISANFEQNQHILIFTIKADRFLRNMVRAIVGTLLDVGMKKITIQQFCSIIESKNRCNAGQSVPGKALFLNSVEYPYSIWH